MKKSMWFGLVAAFAVAMLALTVTKAKAETILGIHTVSYHSSGEYNNTNPGVYVSHNGYTVGTYYNSERRQTYYVGYTFTGNIGGGFGYGLSIGTATGYQRSKFVPMVVPSVSYSVSNDFRVRVSAIPPIAGTPAVAHLSFEYKF